MPVRARWLSLPHRSLEASVAARGIRGGASHSPLRCALALSYGSALVLITDAGPRSIRMPPAQSSLRVWLLIVAGLRSLSVAVALLWPEVLARSVFAAVPQELTALGARVFACWTLTTCCLCVLCAKEGADPSTFTLLTLTLTLTLTPTLTLTLTPTLTKAPTPRARPSRRRPSPSSSRSCSSCPSWHGMAP